MSLKFALYTCPPIPTKVPSPDASSKDSGLWSPLSITLLYTPTTALVVDCPATLYDVSHGDTHANSFIRVPELNLVVAGDIFHNGDCHPWLGEASSPEKRSQWLAALGEIRALRPKIVVPGHTFTPSSTPDEDLATAMLTSTADYSNGFAEELEAATSERNLFERMRSRYDRWNLHLLAGRSKDGWNNRKL
ncbi:metallo-beta-lactamase superfamily [Fusarium agapanthi]|uniref:Metallo-beta-lactamase superfamily n=1 Tax=Fusarium agapanthi TaxID=1803897 RepID=A0A9P5BKL6_9HYPO|nr:metallo-beta-lactamase superfamily [Fusarium agapanthi]